MDIYKTRIYKDRMQSHNRRGCRDYDCRIHCYKWHCGRKFSCERGYDWEEHFWGYVVDTRKCIGCGRCANACKLENDVPFDEEVYRTWIERYRVKKTYMETREEEVVIDSPNGGIDGFVDDIPAEELKKAFLCTKIMQSL